MINFLKKRNVTHYSKKLKSSYILGFLLLETIRTKNCLFIHPLYYTGALWTHPYYKILLCTFYFFQSLSSIVFYERFLKVSNIRYSKKAKKLALKTINRVSEVNISKHMYTIPIYNKIQSMAVRRTEC